ncbi:hypothetical protein K490DRAFT_67067 [Saccharata proteae CBS 121410]|uniref:Uncharacterized protein n=1 Tax=Saccharata proteae CBS 121410 TaxID=1314787 RepID=A0A9P4LXJ5_9PEZI|nr:hypothetical protein K490DRAFT_67067 [Saccharata proteae CBS 121410]
MFGSITNFIGSVVDSVREMHARNAANEVIMPQHMPGSFPPTTEKPSTRVYARVRQARAAMRANRQTETAEYRGTRYNGAALCGEAQLRAMEDFEIGLKAGAFLAGHQKLDMPRMVHVFMHNPTLYKGLDWDVYKQWIAEGAERQVNELVKAVHNGAEAVGEARAALAAQGLDAQCEARKWYEERLAEAEEKHIEALNAVINGQKMDRRRNRQPAYQQVSDMAFIAYEGLMKQDEGVKGKMREQCRKYEDRYFALVQKLRNEHDLKIQQLDADRAAREQALEKEAYDRGYKRGRAAGRGKRKMAEGEAREEGEGRKKRARMSVGEERRKRARN